MNTNDEVTSELLLKVQFFHAQLLVDRVKSLAQSAKFWSYVTNMSRSMLNM